MGPGLSHRVLLRPVSSCPDESRQAIRDLKAERREYQERYDVADVAELTISIDGDSRTITPALIAAVARREEDEDVDVYVERRGLDGLATALEYAFEYVEGTVNHRIAARELDVSPLEAEILLQALEPIAEAYTAE